MSWCDPTSKMSSNFQLYESLAQANRFLTGEWVVVNQGEFKVFPDREQARAFALKQESTLENPMVFCQYGSPLDFHIEHV